MVLVRGLTPEPRGVSSEIVAFGYPDAGADARNISFEITSFDN